MSPDPSFWTKAGTFTGTYGTDFVIESAENITGPWTPETLGGNDVIYIFLSPLGAGRFVGLRVSVSP